jgi:hypothetical protein
MRVFKTIEVHKSPLTAMALHNCAPIIASGSHKQFIKILTFGGEQLSMIRWVMLVPHRHLSCFVSNYCDCRSCLTLGIMMDFWVSVSPPYPVYHSILTRCCWRPAQPIRSWLCMHPPRHSNKSGNPRLIHELNMRTLCARLLLST